MKAASITLLEVTPEEAIKLPGATPLIEYDPRTNQFAIKRSDHCMYDYACVYLLKDPKELLNPAEGKKNRRGEKPKR